jgi:hypothetical protein
MWPGSGPDSKSSEQSVLSRGDGQQVVENQPKGIYAQREMALIREKVRVDSRDVRSQPLAMRIRRKPILQALPDRDWDVDGSEVEAPRLYEGELVVDPAPDAVPHRLPEDVRQPCRWWGEGLGPWSAG